MRTNNIEASTVTVTSPGLRLRRPGLGWVAVAAAGIAATALTAASLTAGEGTADVRAPARSVLEAESVERVARLEGQARTYGAPVPTTAAMSPTWRGVLAGEEADRRAHLEGQAWLFSHRR